jgi:hypothetical protein
MSVEAETLYEREECRRAMKRIKLFLMTAATAAALLVATAGLALAQGNMPERNIPCNSEPAEKGVIGPSEGDRRTNPGGTVNLCPLTPPGKA